MYDKRIVSVSNTEMLRGGIVIVLFAQFERGVPALGFVDCEVLSATLGADWSLRYLM